MPYTARFRWIQCINNEKGSIWTKILHKTVKSEMGSGFPFRKKTDRNMQKYPPCASWGMIRGTGPGFKRLQAGERQKRRCCRVRGECYFRGSYRKVTSRDRNCCMAGASRSSRVAEIPSRSPYRTRAPFRAASISTHSLYRLLRVHFPSSDQV